MLEALEDFPKQKSLFKTMCNFEGGYFCMNIRYKYMNISEKYQIQISRYGH